MTQDALLKLLEADARLSDQQIADRLGVDVATVAAKRAALEKAGRIVGYQAIVNDDAEGVSAFIEVRCTPERGGGFDKLARRIARFPEVRHCYLISGGYDLLLEVRGETLKDVAEFVSSKLATIDGVMSTSTHFMLKKYKELGKMMQDEENKERLNITP